MRLLDDATAGFCGAPWPAALPDYAAALAEWTPPAGWLVGGGVLLAVAAGLRRFGKPGAPGGTARRSGGRRNRPDGTATGAAGPATWWAGRAS